MLRMSRKSELIILAAGIIVLLVTLTWPISDDSWLYNHNLKYTTLTLTGTSPPSDISQDIIGFRALVDQKNAYPILSSAVQELGLSWDVANHVSTHPPTDFLIVAPIAFLPWGMATMIWAWFMFGLLVLTFRIYGLPWLVAFGLTPVALLWPPISYSLGQVTIIWLFGFAMGYRYLQRKKYFMSGLGIGLASLTKVIPALMLVVFLPRKRWSAILGIALVWCISLLILIGLSPTSIVQYAEANRSNLISTILRNDNSALLAVTYRLGGVLGIVLGLVFLVLVLWTNRHYVFSTSEDLPSTELWMLLTYFTVVLLPISWIYSVTPLFPVIFFLLSKRRRFSTFIGLLSLTILFLFPTEILLVSVDVLIGLGLLFGALPVRAVRPITQT